MVGEVKHPNAKSTEKSSGRTTPFCFAPPGHPSIALRLLRRPSSAVRFLRLLAANFPNLFTTDYADSADKKNGQDPDVAQELTEETETQHDTTGDPPRAERTVHLTDPSADLRPLSSISFFLCARAP